MQVGGEYVGYSMTSYSQGIADQGLADFWKEKPVRYAAFVQDRLDIGDVVLQVGLRYDYFSTRASRWNGFPRISTNPALDSLPPGTDPTVLYVPDDSFDELSPRIQVAFPVTERTSFRLSYAQAVETPDFAAVLQRHQHGRRRVRRLRIRPESGLREVQDLRVRHPARVQRRYGARFRGVQP